MRGCGLFFARRRTCSPLPLVALLGRGRELMPALVQVDDDRHRVLDLLFDGVERVLHCCAPERALQRALCNTSAACRGQVPFVRGLPTPKTQHSKAHYPHQPHNRTQHKFCMCPSSHTHNTALTRSTPRQDHPYPVRGNHSPRSHNTAHTTSHDDGRKSLQESRFNSSHLRRERSSR